MGIRDEWTLCEVIWRREEDGGPWSCNGPRWVLLRAGTKLVNIVAVYRGEDSPRAPQASVVEQHMIAEIRRLTPREIRELGMETTEVR